MCVCVLSSAGGMKCIGKTDMVVGVQCGKGALHAQTRLKSCERLKDEWARRGFARRQERERDRYTYILERGAARASITRGPKFI